MEQTFNKYRLINQQTGRIVYFLLLDSTLNDFEERLDKKKTQMAYKKQIPHHKMYWESYT